MNKLTPEMRGDLAVVLGEIVFFTSLALAVIMLIRGTRLLYCLLTVACGVILAVSVLVTFCIVESRVTDKKNTMSHDEDFYR